jgi:hypothetical protein
VPHPDLTLDAVQQAAVARAMAQARDLPLYAYPWQALTEDLDRRGLTHVPVVGYGSLLNSESAAQTLSAGSLEGRRPILAFGVLRLFTRAMSSVATDRSAGNPDVRAALNVRITGRQEDVVNGALIQVAREDLEALRRRERRYDLVPVACVEWDDRTVPPFTAYILVSPEELWRAESAAHPVIEPHPEYYQTCRRGAAEFGDAFLRFWLATTFLADGVTPVSAWEKTRSGKAQHWEERRPA